MSKMIGVMLAFVPTLATCEEKDSKLPASVRIIREADAATLFPSQKRFVVKCNVASEELTFSLPSITVRDGEKVTIADTQTNARVVAYKSEGSQQVAIVREVTEGTKVQITVIGLDDETAVVDATLTIAGKPAGNKRQADKRFSSFTGQMIDCAKFSAPLHCEIGATGVRFEVVVEAAKE